MQRTQTLQNAARCIGCLREILEHAERDVDHPREWDLAGRLGRVQGRYGRERCAWQAQRGPRENHQTFPPGASTYVLHEPMFQLAAGA
jgi:hypothetical protein